MQDVNWWLMVLSFLLGLVLSLALMIRRVKREVPEYGALGRGPGVDVKAPDVDVKGAGGAAGGAAAGASAAGAAKFADTTTEKIPAAVDEPYGPGSARVAAEPLRRRAIRSRATRIRCSTTRPTARRISRRSPKSGSATWRPPRAAGFSRWDSGKSQRGQR